MFSSVNDSANTTDFVVLAFPHLPLWLSWLLVGATCHPLSKALV